MIAQSYATMEYKERRGTFGMIIYKKIMNAPHTVRDEVVYKIESK